MRTETPQDARNLLGAGRKNALYNGSMQIWQRGTSFLGLGSGGVANYTADRWNSTRYASANNNTTRENANYLGFRYCLRSARPSGDTTGTSRYVHQVLEQVDTWRLRNNHITFSFYARVGSGYSGSNIASFITYHIDSTKEERFYYNAFTTAVNYGTTKNHTSLSTNWQRYTHTIFLPTDAQQVGIAIGTPEALPTAVANDYFEITGCQLEVGSAATEFEYRSYGEELALCQRYAFRYAPGGNNSWGLMIGAYTTNRAFATIFTPVELRDTPSITYTGTPIIYTFSLTGSIAITGISGYSRRGNLLSLDCYVSSGLTVNSSYWLLLDNAVFSSEL